MLDAYINAWKKAFNFKGRSTRKDYWFFQLITGVLVLIMFAINFYIPVLLYEIDNELLYKLSEIGMIFYLLLIFGTAWVNIALTVRRIRDVGMRWYWIFFALIPNVGQFYIFIFLLGHLL